MLHRNAVCLWAALHALFSPVAADSQCPIEPHAIVTDACISYASIEKLNRAISPSLRDLTQETDFFAYYRLNLYNKVCPFWNEENSMCGNRACAVDTIEDEKDIPLIWRTEELSKLEGARAEHPGRSVQKKRPVKRPLNHQLGDDVDESCVYEADDECDERDYCVPEDEGAASKGDYVSLVNNTERFTGYSGPGAWQVWDSIYKENCFTPQRLSHGSKGPSRQQAAKELRNVFQEYGRQNVDSQDDLYPLDDECLEQRAFYRIISGMHASISTHICWDYFNQTNGQWVRNLQCYKDRLHKHPERVSNLYFNYALVSRAISKLRKHLQSYTFCSGDPDQDFTTKQKVLQLADQITAAPHTFDESLMFRDPDMMELKDDFKQRFRNVSRVMDCVGCDKCRLWGKVQTAGYGAALKVLFEFDETKNGENPHLRRTELVALINTFARLSHSLEAVQKFRQAVAAGDSSVLEDDGVKAADNIDSISKESTSTTPETDHDQALLEENSIRDVKQDEVEEDDDDDEIDEEDDDDEEDEEEDWRMAYKNRAYDPDQPLSEIFFSEFALIWRTYKMVLRSWIELPFKMSAIFVSEMQRAWQFWLGLPVRGRSWEIRIPRAREL